SEAAGELGDLSEEPIENPPSWARYVTGVDQALEKVRSEVDERLLQEQEPATPQDPGTTRLDQDDARGPHPVPSLARAASEERGRLAAGRERLGAVGRVLG